ncbi:uncharacterized protein EI90DRAFT_3154155 [Cantharellus anzutake]|uniref:uncharacterized protein n=1 Tax=Cantharellus anzutake TaxID=1750568 RepID=UPI001905E0DC|nr:uncharacterized protein EI90DRAFT_3154155 [Cantharellus anzutake]KAF8332859.1 hypothetical protein EI90DRAFT_3154155 [Cantharellus anzutake]
MSPEPGIDADHADPDLPTNTASGLGNALDPEVTPSPVDDALEAGPDGAIDLAGNVETFSEPLANLAPPPTAIWHNQSGVPAVMRTSKRCSGIRTLILRAFPNFNDLQCYTLTQQILSATKANENLGGNNGVMVKQDSQTRYYKHITIFPNALVTANRWQLIDGTIIDVYIEMLKDLTDKNLWDLLSRLSGSIFEGSISDKDLLDKGELLLSDTVSGTTSSSCAPVTSFCGSLAPLQAG